MTSFTISPLCDKNMKAWLMCMKTWDSGFFSERKAAWYERMKERGLGVQVAHDEAGTPVGFIQYLPAHLSFVAGGEGLYLIQCIWVHGYGEGLGNRRGRGSAKRFY